MLYFSPYLQPLKYGEENYQLCNKQKIASFKNNKMNKYIHQNLLKEPKNLNFLECRRYFEFNILNT